MEKIAVIGAGLIGRAWAMVFARAGHPVALYDAAPGAVDQAIGLIRDGLAETRHFGLIAESPDAIMPRIRAATSLEDAIADADYVQENTSEREDVKRDVFSKMDAAAKPDCILASSTSTIQTSRFAGHVPGRHRCLVAHPVNPPHVVPIVELSPAPFTSPEVVERARVLHERAGQVPITGPQGNRRVHPQPAAGSPAHRIVAPRRRGLRVASKTSTRPSATASGSAGPSWAPSRPSTSTPARSSSPAP
jgi:L-gulonate 3-dehydrogenase